MIIDYIKLDNTTKVIFDMSFKTIEYIIIKDNVFDRMICTFSKEKDYIFFESDKKDVSILILILQIDNIFDNNVYKIPTDCSGIRAIITKKPT
jgi:hypothetical protein